MEEQTEIPDSFYKLGKIETPKKFSSLDPKWKKFDSLSEAIDDQINQIASPSERGFLKVEDNFQESPVLDKDRIKGFIQRFGYDLESTTFRRISKNHFAVVSQVDTSTIVEIFKYYDFENNLVSVNTRDRISVEGIVVSSPKGESIVLTQPFSHQGFFVNYYSQDSTERPVNIQHRNVGIDAISSHPLGAVANPTSDQFAALQLLHELRHVDQEEMKEYEAELEASEYALQMNRFLHEAGINITPRISNQQARQYLLNYLLGYAKKHHPFRTFIHCVAEKLPIKPKSNRSLLD